MSTSGPPGYQSRPAISTDGGGGFVVAWEHASGSYGVYARRFDANGAPLGPDFKVNAHDPWGANPQSSLSSPSVAAAKDGSFVVAWQAWYNDGQDFNVLARMYDAAGAENGREFRVNSWTTSAQTEPEVAMDAQGNFVVVWADRKEGGSLYEVWGRVYERSGTVPGSEFQVNNYTTKIQTPFDVAWDNEGRLIVGWLSNTFNVYESGNGVFARRFAPDLIFEDGFASVD